jgi:hypothetical protein
MSVREKSKNKKQMKGAGSFVVYEHKHTNNKQTGSKQIPFCLSASLQSQCMPMLILLICVHMLLLLLLASAVTLLSFMHEAIITAGKCKQNRTHTLSFSQAEQKH